MDTETCETRTAPEIPARIKRILCEKLAARVDSAASMVEASHLVRGYCSKDPADIPRLIAELERTFGIQLNATELEKTTTVGELGVLIDERLSVHSTKERGYIVIYRNAEGDAVEAHVRAANHNEAVARLHAEGLQEVLAVQREEDEDDDRRYSRGRRRNGCLLPLFLALVAGALVVAFYWYRRH